MLLTKRFVQYNAGSSGEVKASDMWITHGYGTAPVNIQPDDLLRQALCFLAENKIITRFKLYFSVRTSHLFTEEIKPVLILGGEEFIQAVPVNYF